MSKARFSSGGTCGVFGAATGTAALMGLNAKKITWALGILEVFPPVLWKVTPQRLAETAAGRPPGYDGRSGRFSGREKLDRYSFYV